MKGEFQLVRKGMLWRYELCERAILRLAYHGVLRVGYEKSGVGIYA
jgi:hypothetical protein